MVFLVDDMGVMDTSVLFLVDSNGNPKRYPLNDYYRTPAMERLAERGIRRRTWHQRADRRRCACSGRWRRVSR